MTNQPISPSAKPLRPAHEGDEVAWSAADLQTNPHAASDKAQRVQKMFAAIAGRYDLNNRLHSFGRDQVWRRRAVALCEIRPTEDVLDVACGTGDLTLAFADAHPRSVTGLDFTEAMLQIARDKSSRFSVSRRVTYVQGDAMALPFGNGTFDVVSIAFGIRNVAEPQRALNEFHRVLRPKGRLVVLEFSRPNNRCLRWLNDLYTKRVMPLTATLIARDRSGAYRYLPRSVESFALPQEFKQQLTVCGFTNVTSHQMTFGVCTAYIARKS